MSSVHNDLWKPDFLRARVIQILKLYMFLWPQLEKQKKILLTEMLLVEQCGREVSQTYEELPNSRDTAVKERPPRARKVFLEYGH